MDLFENGKLKEQKLKLDNMMCKPEFKQQYLAPIRTLPDEDQCNLLQKVIDREINLNDLKILSAQRKTILALRSTFVKSTNCTSWEEAQEKFPLYASDTQLSKFQDCDLKKMIPKRFEEFCLRAKNSSSGHSSVTSESFFSIDNQDGPPSTVNIIRAKCIDVTGHTIKVTQSLFCGVDLAIVQVNREVCKLASYIHVHSHYIATCV